MKPIRTNRFLIILSALSSFAHGASLTWDGNGAVAPNPDGGTGTWDVNTTTNWWDGATNVVWPTLGGTDNDAVFANTAGTVSLATGGITANDITFGTTGYTIQSNTLTLNGTTPTITTTTGVTATIKSIIAGSVGLRKADVGTLILTGVNTYTTGTTINGGTLQIGDGVTNGTMNGAFTTAAAGTLRYIRAVDTTAPTWANVSGSGVLSVMTNRANSGATNDWGQAALPVGFTGTLQIERGRVSTNTATSIGSATAVVVQSGGQLGMWNGGSFTQNFTIAGSGYGETGYDSALRLANGAVTTTISGNVALSANATIAATGTGIISGVVSGASGSVLTVGTSSQAGTTRLTGINTYSGNTAIGYGTLEIGGAGQLGSGTYAGAISLATSTTLNYNSTAAQTLSGVISGAGRLTKSAAGTLTLSGANTYTGITTFTAGTLSVATIGNGGVAGNLGQATNAAANLVFNGGTLQYTGATASTDRNFTLNAATTSTIEIANGANTLTMSGSSTATSGGLTKSGAGTLVLAGTSAYTGATTLSAGKLSVAAINNGGVAGNLGQATNAVGNLVFNGGTLLYTGATASTDRGFTINTGITGTVEIPTLGSVLTISGASAATDGALTKTGAGMLTLSGVHLYTGATTVSAGALNVTGSLASPVTVASGTILFGQGGSTSSTLTLNAGSSIYGVTQVAGAGNAFRAAGAVTAGSTVTILGSDGSATVGSHSIDVLGYGTTPGTANFSTAKYRSATLTDDTVNQKLTLTYTSTGKTWNSASSTWDALTTNAWQEGDFKFSQGDAVVFNDTGTGGGAARTVTLNSVVTPGSVAFGNSTSTYTVSGTGSIGGLTSLTKTGTGTTNLSTANTYTGGTAVNGGQLVVRNQNALGTGAVTVATGGVLSFGPTGMNVTNDVTLNGGMLSGGLDNGTIANIYSGNLTLGASGGTITTYWSDKTLTVTKPITGSGNLTVALQQAGNGAPNIVLTANNTYTGTTIISAGSVTVGNGATSGSLGTGDVANNGNLTFNRSDSYTVTNTITGTGALFPRGGGTMTIGGTTANTFTGNLDLYQSGNTTVILAKPAGVTAIAGNIRIGTQAYGSTGFLQLGASDQIADTSIMTLYGYHYTAGGVFSLMGNNETIGGLVAAISGNGTATSTIVRNQGATDSTLTLNPLTGSTYSYSYGNMPKCVITNGSTGKLNIVKNGAGTQVFGATTTYTGTTTVNAGTLSLRGTAGIGQGNGLIAFNSSATTVAGGTLDLQYATFNAALSGTSGSVTVTGGNTINFGGANKTYSVDTVISGASTILIQTAANSLAALSLHNIGTGATLRTGNFAASVKALTGAGAVDLNGAAAILTIADGSSQNFSGAIAGAGGLTKAGSGTQTLSGTNAYTGTTLISGGILQIGSGSTTGALASTSAITNNANLTINRSNAVAQGTDFGAISGTGSLTQSGAGTTTLTTNTYTGDTNVLGGQLDLSGTSIADTGKLVINGGKVGLGTSVNETVATLFYGATQQIAGTYGSSASSATFKDDTRFAGTGIVTVTGDTLYGTWATLKGLTGLNKLSSADADGDGFKNLMEFAFGTDPTSAASGPVSWTGSVVNAHGQPTTSVTNIVNGVDFRAVFGRRLDYVAAGLTYTVQFSAGLDVWENSVAVPTVLASDSEIDVVSVPYPMFIQTPEGAKKPTFFRVQVTGP